MAITIFKVNCWTSGGSSSGGLSGFNNLSAAMAGAVGEVFADLLDVDDVATGFSLDQLTVQTGTLASSGYAASSPEPSIFPVWFFRGWHKIGDGSLVDCYRISGLPVGGSYTFRPAGNESDENDTTYYATGGDGPVTYDRTGDDPVAAPPTMTGTVPGDGIVVISAESNDNAAVFNGFLFSVDDAGAAEPTITNIDGGTEYTPGDSVVLNGTNFSTSGGSIVINGETQTITNRTATAITFTAVRGGNPYDQDLTLTYTDADSNTATLTVQQVAGTDEYAVTAASPNTTDDASLWTGLVDTGTGDPITIVNGDQALLKDNVGDGLGNLTATPAGEISADTEGDFTVQIWLASEGVWGSDQTVTFAEADEAAPVIESVDVPADDTYTPSETLSFTVNWDESVSVTGTPAINFTIGGSARQANYASGTDTAALVFSYTVASGDNGAVSVASLTLDGGTIKDAAGNDATLTLNSVGDTSGVLVDGVAPVITINGLTATDTTPVVSGSAGDAVSLTLVVNSITYNPAPSGGAWSQQLPELALDTYPMTLNGQDSAGNEAVEANGVLNVVSEIATPINSRIGFKRSMRRPAMSSIKEAIKS